MFMTASMPTIIFGAVMILVLGFGLLVQKLKRPKGFVNRRGLLSNISELIF